MEVEWLILADAAQVVGDKLYLMGGGWDRITLLRDFPTDHALAVAAAFRVPWNEINRPYPFSIVFKTEDDLDTELARIDGQVEAGRPPGSPAGQAQRVQMALNAQVRIDRLGVYVVEARVGDSDARRVTFHVTPGPGVQRQSQEGAA